MNILAPDSWLKEHLKTKANLRQISRYLSLCSQSVEKTTKIGNDYVYEIEITTNRPDCLSVYGIARELAAILPRFGIKTSLKKLSFKDIPKTTKNLPLEVKISKSSLCPRFTSLIFDNITIKPSPKIVRERLEKSGIRALNNVVDISNYLMIELGQPMHTFDYDKIKGAKMILREAKAGEKIVTLDGQTRLLPKGAIVIEDGNGRLIDLCGIMGGKNSEVDENTKRVLLFVQTYNPAKIRLTCQALAFRTEAAQRFEKGVDPEGVIPAMKKAVAMFEENCKAKIASPLIDIYPNPPKTKKVILPQEKLNKILGISLRLSETKDILKNLGFGIKLSPDSKSLAATVPHWRNEDINIPEDLIEEIARIYGYHRLPSVLLEGQIPLRIKNPLLNQEEQIKDMLKFWGFTETLSYSIVGSESLQKIEVNPRECLKISNPLTEELVFLRPSLIPSILEVISKNKDCPRIKIFELANVYLPKTNNQLPDEVSTLTVAITGDKFFYLKGILEAIFKELGITNLEVVHYPFRKTFSGKIFHPTKTAEVLIKDHPVGILGEIKPAIFTRFGIEKKIVILEINLGEITKFTTFSKKYTPIPKYPAIVEDLAFVVPPRTEVGKIIQLIKLSSPIIQSVELLDSYKDTRTFRITYQSAKKTLTDKEVGKIRNNIAKKVKIKFKAKLKDLPFP